MRQRYRNAALILTSALWAASAVHAQVAVKVSDGWRASVLFPIIFPPGTQGASYSSAGPGQLPGMYFGTTTGGNNHALLWNSSAMSPIDLHPAAYLNSTALGTDGPQQVGYGAVGSDPVSTHALLWSATAASVVDLNPSMSTGIAYTQAFAVRGNEQVGRGWTNVGGAEHALSWHGTAASAVDLNPTNLQNVTGSIAVTTDGVHEAGGVSYSQSYGYHAVVWTGSASSAVDLHPAGYAFSEAFGVSGSQQVGWGGTETTSASAHALLWNGTPDSVVDLHPAALGFTNSEADGTNGVNQVGRGYSQSLGYHALYWGGTASSAVDLQTLLPAIPNNTWQTSSATYIDSDGNVFGVANSYLVEWSPVPEPAMGSVLAALAGVCMLSRRRA